MKRFLLALVLISFASAIGILSFLLGERLVTQKYKKLDEMLSDASVGFFCASPTCTLVGLKGDVSTYDYGKKIINLSVNGRSFEISISRITRVDDNNNGVSFFEENFRKGDVITITFKKILPLSALNIYFDKTGVLTKKRIL